jgi:hypothetical protein
MKNLAWRTGSAKGAFAGLMAMAWMVTALGAAAQTPAPAPAPAPAPLPGDHVLKLTNTGKGVISAVFVAPTGSQNFTDDLLGAQVAGVGRTVRIKVKDPTGTCVFDVQFLMDDGKLETRTAVNLCQTDAYTFSR